MATMVLDDVLPTFPEGTVVTAYERRSILAGPIDSDTVASGSLVFTGLTPGRTYVAQATVSSVDRRLVFSVGTTDEASAPISASTSGLTLVVDGISGKRIKITGYLIVASGAVSVKFVSGAANDMTGLMAYAQNGGAAPEVPLWTERGESLSISLSAAVAVGGHVSYEVVD